jgi:hypothetical protein
LTLAHAKAILERRLIGESLEQPHLFDLKHRANKTFSTALYGFGEFVKEAVRMPYRTVNPFNREVLCTFDQHTDQQMEQMLANADKTFREIRSFFLSESGA